MAAAFEIARGKVLYRDIWFDKPPLFAWFYSTLGLAPGLSLRIAGAAVVLLGAAVAWRWHPLAGALLGFYLTFGIPAAVMAAAPDLLMVPVHLGAIWAAAQGRSLWAGALCGLCFMLNPKAPFVLLAVCAWDWRRIAPVLAAFVAVQLPLLSWLLTNNAWQPYWQQVWVWGFVYSRDTPFDEPWREGLIRTLNWAGFQAPLVVGAVLGARRRWRMGAWIALSLTAVLAGLRFFPRYYFQLLAPMAVAGSLGLAALPRKWRLALLLLLLIPAVRFGPRYLQQAMGQPWSDLALHDDAREVATLLNQRQARTLLVWGYRPEVYAYSRVRAATPFLDSQPLTGVIADRHLRSAEATFEALAKKNRTRLVAYDPHFIVDGLGVLNPRLAIANYEDLRAWMARYREVARTRFSIVYALR